MRTFLAIEIPATVQTLIRQAQQEMATLLAAAQLGQTMRWTAPAAVHLTVRFLGETTEAQYQALQGLLPQVIAGQKTFTLMVQEMGGFPNMHAPTIIWLGLQPADQTLFRLQTRIEQTAQTIGFAAERKPFQPHLTIGRVRHTIERAQQRLIGQTLARLPAVTPQSQPPISTFTVTHIVHMQSQLEATGARYTPLQRFPLAAG